MVKKILAVIAVVIGVAGCMPGHQQDKAAIAARKIKPAAPVGSARGGNKSLFFGSVKGTYKLIWIDCQGDVTGHSR